MRRLQQQHWALHGSAPRTTHPPASRQPPSGRPSAVPQVNEVAFSRSGKLFLQATQKNDVEASPPPATARLRRTAQRRTAAQPDGLPGDASSRAPTRGGRPKALLEPPLPPPPHAPALFSLQVFRFPEMKKLRTLQGHTAPVLAVAVDPQGK